MEQLTCVGEAISGFGQFSGMAEGTVGDLGGLPCPVVQLGAGVLPISAEETFKCPMCRCQGVYVAAVVIEVLQGLGGIVDGGLREGRQGVFEVSGKIDVDAVADAGVTDHVEEADVLVEVGPSKQPAAMVYPLPGSGRNGWSLPDPHMGTALLRLLGGIPI